MWIPSTAVKPSGFIIPTRQGWFGSSPDGVVINSLNTACIGLLEVKCPYTKQDEEACENPIFYCYICS